MEFAGSRIFDPHDVREIKPVDVRRVVDQAIADWEDDQEFREMRRAMLSNRGVRL